MLPGCIPTFGSFDNMTTKRTMIVMAGAAAMLAGCKAGTTDNTSNYTKAINTYYASRPLCLWSQSQKLPVQVDSSDQSKTSGYDALVDQGVLQRTTDEKKRFLIGSKQVTNYDLSEKGRSAWTPDQQQPGYGNFCYGTPAVSSIDSSTPTNSQPGATTTVTYHTHLDHVPSWAQSNETKTAFPSLAAELAGPVAGSAVLTDTDSGWTVTSGPKSPTGGATGADGSIVQ
jgi:hypothetical protein